MKVLMTSVFAATLIASGCAATAARAADSIVGTWRLVSVSEQETETKAIRKPLGDHPLGLLTYTADGHVAFIMADPSRKPAATPKATDAEAAALYRTMAAYSGTYHLDGDALTNHVAVAWNQAWNGTDLHRIVVIAGNTLTATTAPFVSPFYGKEIVSTLVFEREP